MSECKSPAADESFEVSQVKSMDKHRLVLDWTQDEWQRVNLLEFVATTIDLRIVLFQAEEPFLANWRSFRRIKLPRCALKILELPTLASKLHFQNKFDILILKSSLFPHDM